MKVSREKAAENRERIIDAAGALFRSKGFNGIGVADIMKAADLTHGGFYGHFASKDDLAAQASQRAMASAINTWTKIVANAPGKPYEALLRHYLSAHHRDDPGRGCAFAALGADAGRGGQGVRDAFAEGLRALIDVLAPTVPGPAKAPSRSRRREALATMSELVGAVILARSVGDTALSNEILAATRQDLCANGRHRSRRPPKPHSVP